MFVMAGVRERSDWTCVRVARHLHCDVLGAADQREKSKRNDERSQHESSWPAISQRINQGPRSGCGERQA
jgi:hypothetical protein